MARTSKNRFSHDVQKAGKALFRFLIHPFATLYAAGVYGLVYANRLTQNNALIVCMFPVTFALGLIAHIPYLLGEWVMEPLRGWFSDSYVPRCISIAHLELAKARHPERYGNNLPFTECKQLIEEADNNPYSASDSHAIMKHAINPDYDNDSYAILKHALNLNNLSIKDFSSTHSIDWSCKDAKQKYRVIHASKGIFYSENKSPCLFEHDDYEVKKWFSVTLDGIPCNRGDCIQIRDPKNGTVTKGTFIEVREERGREGDYCSLAIVYTSAANKDEELFFHFFDHVIDACNNITNLSYYENEVITNSKEYIPDDIENSSYMAP